MTWSGAAPLPLFLTRARSHLWEPWGPHLLTQDFYCFKILQGSHSLEGSIWAHLTKPTPPAAPRAAARAKGAVSVSHGCIALAVSPPFPSPVLSHSLRPLNSSMSFFHVCVCVCMVFIVYTCTYMYVNVCGHKCGGAYVYVHIQTWSWHQACSSIILHPCIDGRRVSHWTQSLLTFGYQAWPGHPSLCFLSAIIADDCHTYLAFMWVLGVQTLVISLVYRVPCSLSHLHGSYSWLPFALKHAMTVPTQSSALELSVLFAEFSTSFFISFRPLFKFYLSNENYKDALL